MADGIIDLGEYLRRREGGEESASTFALWGADGERSRFALPLWRAIYLASGERGGILWQEEGGSELQPFVVLDLAQDPPRLDFPGSEVTSWEGDRAPEVLPTADGGLAIYLGREAGRRWFVVVRRERDGVPSPKGRDREDIMFLAGECAGLLFLRDFAAEARERQEE